MTTPTVIAFDLGNVLLGFDYSIAGRRIAAQTQLSDIEVQKFLDQSPLLYRFETGLMTQAEFFEEVRLRTGFRGSFEEFSGFFADIFWEIPPMVELHARLRRKGLPTYIF
jgi:putative hydrolase of the HAD superfamily